MKKATEYAHKETRQQENAVIANDFELAASRRDETEALKRLIAWYEWFRTQQ